MKYQHKHAQIISSEHNLHSTIFLLAGHSRVLVVEDAADYHNLAFVTGTETVYWEDSE